MDDHMTSQLARAGTLFFGVLYLAAFVAVVAQGHPGWLLSLLNGIALLGGLAYAARWGRLSDFALVAGYAGAAAAVAMSALLLLGDIHIAEGLMPLPVELGFGLLWLFALTSLWWHYRRQPRQRQRQS